MVESLQCHLPYPCKEGQFVERLDGTTVTMTVHKIQEMHSNGSLMGYILDHETHYGTIVMRAPEWVKWYEQSDE